MDPGNWINHFDIFENNFVEFLNESVEISNAVPTPLTIYDVKTLIDSSIVSKIHPLLNTSNPIISSPIYNSGVNSLANIANQGHIANVNKEITPHFLPVLPHSNKIPQSTFVVQIRDKSTEPFSGIEIFQLTKSLIDIIALKIKINNEFINKYGKYFSIWNLSRIKQLCLIS